MTLSSCFWSWYSGQSSSSPYRGNCHPHTRRPRSQPRHRDRARSAGSYGGRGHTGHTSHRRTPPGTHRSPAPGGTEGHHQPHRSHLSPANPSRHTQEPGTWGYRGISSATPVTPLTGEPLPAHTGARHLGVQRDIISHTGHTSHRRTPPGTHRSPAPGGTEGHHQPHRSHLSPANPSRHTQEPGTWGYRGTSSATPVTPLTGEPLPAHTGARHLGVQRDIISHTGHISHRRTPPGTHRSPAPGGTEGHHQPHRSHLSPANPSRHRQEPGTWWYRGTSSATPVTPLTGEPLPAQTGVRHLGVQRDIISHTGHTSHRRTPPGTHRSPAPGGTEGYHQPHRSHLSPANPSRHTQEPGTWGYRGISSATPVTPLTGEPLPAHTGARHLVVQRDTINHTGHTSHRRTPPGTHRSPAPGGTEGYHQPHRSHLSPANPSRHTQEPGTWGYRGISATLVTPLTGEPLPAHRTPLCICTVYE